MKNEENMVKLIGLITEKIFDVALVYNKNFDEVENVSMFDEFDGNEKISNIEN